MKNLVLHPVQQELVFYAPQAEAAALRDGTSTTGWKVTKKKGIIPGIAVSVSGAGAYAEMCGEFTFSLKMMESSRTYQKMVKDYSISGGISGFWGWLSIGANASTHKTEIQEALQEMAQSQEVTGTVKVKLMVTGLYPNIQVEASAYVFILQITDEQGSTATVCSGISPSANIGAQDQNGSNLPVTDNDSTITI